MKTKTATKKRVSNKKTYIDVLTQKSRFPELKWKSEWTDLIARNFVAEAAKRCLEVKSKYGILGKSLSAGKAVEICFKEGLYIDVESSDNFGEPESYVAKTENGDYVVWINPDLEVKIGQDLMIIYLSSFLLPEYRDLLFAPNTYTTFNELLETPELFKATMLAECLRAMLLANESTAELIAYLSAKHQVKIMEKTL
jgi:hypothetical protein